MRKILTLIAVFSTAFLFAQKGQITPETVRPAVGVGRTDKNGYLMISGQYRGQNFAPIWANASDVIDIFGSAGFTVMPTPEDTTAINLYLPSHGWTADTLAAYPGGILPLNYRNQKADATTELNSQNKYVIGIVSPDTVRVRFQGLIYRPSHGLSVTSPNYYLSNTPAVSDTVQGTVESRSFIVVDSNYIFLSEIGIKAESSSLFLPDVRIPASAISVFGGDPIAITDDVINTIAQLYANAGRIKIGSRLITTFTTLSANKAYQNSDTPSNVWLWNGVSAVRVKELVVDINLQDGLYGGSGTIPLDPLIPAGSAPTDTEVLAWYSQNTANRGLVLFNGAKMYWVGTGSTQNPDYIWELQDDLSSGAYIKRIKQPSAGATVNGLASWSVDSIYLSTENTLYNGVMYRAIENVTGERPDTSIKWVNVSVDNPAKQIQIDSIITQKILAVDTDIDSIVFTSKFNSRVSIASLDSDEEKISLPNIAPIQKVEVISEVKKGGAYIEGDLKYKGRVIDKYYLSDEKIEIEKYGSWNIVGTDKKNIGIDQSKYYTVGDQVGNYRIQGTPPDDDRFFVNSGGVYVDGAVIPLKSAIVQPRNRLLSSEKIGARGWLSTSGLGTLSEGRNINNVLGRKTATKVTALSTNAKLRSTGVTTTLNAGDTITISGWIRPGTESFNNNLVVNLTDIGSDLFAPGSATLDIDMTLKEWQYFTQSFIYLTGNVNFDVQLLGDVGDYIWVDMWQYDVNTSIPHVYNTTTWESYPEQMDTVYAVYYPSDGVGRLDDLPVYSPTTDDVLLSQLFEYGSQTGFYKTVELTRDVYTYDEIIIPDGMGLDMMGHNIYYVGSDTTVSVVHAVNDGPNAYAKNQFVRNGTIETISQAYSAIRFEESYKMIIENVTLLGSDVSERGVTDRDDGQLASLKVILSNVYAGKFKYGVYFENSNLNVLDVCSLLQNSVSGIHNTKGRVFINKGTIEANGVNGLFANAGSFVIDGTYFESNPTLTTAETADTNNIIRITFASTVELKNIVFNGADETPYYVVHAENVDKLIMDNLYFSGGTGDKFLHIDCTVKDWTLKGSSAQVRRFFQSVFSDPNVCLQNGQFYENGNLWVGNSIDNLNSKDSKIDRSSISNSTLSGQIFLDNVLLNTKIANFGANSETWPEPTAGGASFTRVLDAELKPGGVAGVSADSTAELIITTATATSSAAWGPWTMLKNPQAGVTYTVRFKAKAKALNSLSRPYFVFRVGSETSNQAETAAIIDTTWREYYARFTPIGSAGALTMRYGATYVGDTIAVSGLTINEGYFPDQHQETEAILPDTSIVTLETAHGKTLKVINDFQVEAAFLDSDGDAGTAGQVLSSTSTGTNWINTSAIVAGDVTALTTSGTGVATIPHGLGVTPSSAVANCASNGNLYYIAGVTFDATNIYVNIFERNSDVAAPSVGLNISWIVVR